MGFRATLRTLIPLLVLASSSPALAQDFIATRLQRGAQLKPTTVLPKYASGNGLLYLDASDGNLLKLKKPDATIMTLGSGVSTILDEGGALTQYSKLNFIGAGVSCVNNAGALRTDCTITGGGGGGGTLASSYAAGASQTDSTMLLDATRLGVRIRDNATPITGDIFSVQNSAGSSTFFGITPSAVTFGVDIRAATDNARSIGAFATKFSYVYTRNLDAGSSSNLSLRANGNERVIITDASSQTITSGMADGAGAVAHILNTTTSWSSNTDRKLLSVRNNATEVLHLNTAGHLLFGIAAVGARIGNLDDTTIDFGSTSSITLRAGGTSVVGFSNSSGWTPTVSDGTWDLGTGSTRWKTVFATKAAIGGTASTYTMAVGPDRGGAASNIVATFSKGDATSASLFVGASMGTVAGMEFGWDNTNSVTYINTGNFPIEVWINAARKYVFGSASFSPQTDLGVNLGGSANRFAETWSRRYAGVEQTIAAASTITLDPASGEQMRVTLSATAITTINGAAGKAGEQFCVEIIQDGTGSRSISGWASGTNGFLLAGGAYTVTSTANKRDQLCFRWDTVAAKWAEMSRAMNL